MGEGMGGASGNGGGKRRSVVVVVEGQALRRVPVASRRDFYLSETEAASLTSSVRPFQFSLLLLILEHNITVAVS